MKLFPLKDLWNIWYLQRRYCLDQIRSGHPHTVQTSKRCQNIIFKLISTQQENQFQALLESYRTTDRVLLLTLLKLHIVKRASERERYITWINLICLIRKKNRSKEVKMRFKVSIGG